MSEESHGVDTPPASKVTEYVLSKTKRYETLNAPTLEKGDEKFRKALISAVKKSGAGQLDPDQPDIEGGALLVSRLADSDDIVLKRLKTAAGNPWDMDEDEYWEKIQEEHKIVEKYFGRKFVPYTEFVTINGSLGDNYVTFSDKEHVMVQEELTGEEFHRYNFDSFPQPSVVSSELKNSIIEFVKHYETMMREENAVIDDEVIIDEAKGSVKIVDTNGLIHFDIDKMPDEFKNYAKHYLEVLNINPEMINTTGEVIKALALSLPELDFHGLDYYQAINLLNSPETKSTFYNRYYRSDDPDFTPDNDFSEGFDSLLDVAEKFPPTGYHSPYIRGLMGTFRITDLDLAA